MQILSHSLELVAVSSITPHPRNPRIGNLEAIKNSISASGFYGYCVCQTSTRFILAGSHRHQAAVELGATTIPVLWVDVPDASAIRILLSDNRTSDIGTMDTTSLVEALHGLISTADGLVGTGYDPAALDALLVSAPPSETDSNGADAGNSGPACWTCPKCKGTFTE